MIIRYNKLSFFRWPAAMMQFAMGNKIPLHNAMLMDAARRMLGNNFNASEASAYLREIASDEFIPMNKSETMKVVGNRPRHFFGKFIYFIVRCMKPETIIETGVSHGVSSWNILNALHRNNKGKLYSIDLPDHDTNRNYNMEEFKTSIGWVVPEVLKHRWELRLGDSKKLLPELLNELKSIDIFFHDSDHSYDFMTFEYKTSYPFIRNGGLLLSDDVHVHSAFDDFVSKQHMQAIKFNAKGGVAHK
jgi:predicted O-methyltransferase YrrM